MALITLRASEAAAQCIVIAPVCLCACLFGSVITIIRNACIDPHQTGFACKGTDCLQLIKFWPSRAFGKGVCGARDEIFGSALLQPARSVVFASPPSAFSFRLKSTLPSLR